MGDDEQGRLPMGCSKKVDLEASGWLQEVSAQMEWRLLFLIFCPAGHVQVQVQIKSLVKVRFFGLRRLRCICPHGIDWSR